MLHKIFFCVLGGCFFFASTSLYALSIPELKELFKAIYETKSGFFIPQEEIKALEQKGACSVYGEILPESLETLLGIMNAEWLNNAVFVDMGSGVGKTVIQASLRVKKAVGIELSSTRIKHSHEALKDVLALKPDAFKGKTIVFKEEDMLTADLSFEGDPTIVYLCSTCFESVDKDALKKIMNRLHQFENVKIIISLNQLSYDLKVFRFLGFTQLPMTWNTQTPVYIYARRDVPDTAFGPLLSQIQKLKTE